MATKLVWGQDCTGIRHFDCLLAASVRSVQQREIVQYFSATKKRDKEKPWPGDIVTIGEHHIGIIYDKNTVINATDGAHCVLREKYVPSKWTRLGRFQDEDL